MGILRFLEDAGAPSWLAKTLDIAATVGEIGLTAFPATSAIGATLLAADAAATSVGDFVEAGVTNDASKRRHALIDGAINLATAGFVGGTAASSAISAGAAAVEEAMAGGVEAAEAASSAFSEAGAEAAAEASNEAHSAAQAASEVAFEEGALGDLEMDNLAQNTSNADIAMDSVMTMEELGEQPTTWQNLRGAYGGAFKSGIKKAIATEGLKTASDIFFEDPEDAFKRSAMDPAQVDPNDPSKPSPGGPGTMGGGNITGGGGGLDIAAPAKSLLSGLVKVGRSLFANAPKNPVTDSNLPDSVIFDVMRRNDSSLHEKGLLFAHDSVRTDILYVRGTSNINEWRGNVTGANDQQLLRAQTAQVVGYIQKQPMIRHVIGHSRGGAIAHDAAHLTGRMFCGIDAAMILCRGPGALRARNINKTGGFDRTLDPIGPIERTADGTEQGLSEKIHHAELGKYTEQVQSQIGDIPEDMIATGFERGGPNVRQAGTASSTSTSTAGASTSSNIGTSMRATAQRARDRIASFKQKGMRGVQGARDARARARVALKQGRSTARENIRNLRRRVAQSKAPLNALRGALLSQLQPNIFV